MQQKITVVPYDPSWETLFAFESISIQQALGQNCLAIHHIGSTSIPELDAKPIIDILAVVHQLHFSESELEAIGYRYRGNINLPFRRYFTLKSNHKRIIHLHVFEKDDDETTLNLLFRDYLRQHPDARDAYARLKYSLLREVSSHEKNGSLFTGYTLGKNAFIQEILKKGGFDGYRFVFCTHDLEWMAVNHLRQKYFFENHISKDSHEAILNHQNHHHLVLYKGTEIIGYAHIEVWEKRGTLRLMTFVEGLQEVERHRSRFFSFCERWLKSQGYHPIDIPTIHGDSITFHDAVRD